MIRFSRFLWIYGFVSGIVLVPGILSLLVFGFRPSIDFTGGTLLEIRFSKSVSQSQIEDVAKKQGADLSSIQKTGEQTFLLRMKAVDDAKVTALETSVAGLTSEKNQIVRKETVGPVLGRELLSKAVAAAILAIIAILLYVAYAFKNIRFGFSAIIALAHDLLVVMGCFSLFGHFLGVEVDTLFVTAFLTTMSFSVHDTIVVFDRIRELSKHSRQSFEDICDRALTETMGRSLTNSVTIMLMLVALVLMGGASVKWFAAALLIGTISGTYSSPFIATPILILWHRFETRKRK